MASKLNWKLPGNVVPPITPFDDNGEVDYKILAHEIDYVVAYSRPAAICVAGVEAQEYQYLSDEQRRLLIRETIGMIDGRVPALVGVSHASYRTSIGLAEYAKYPARRRAPSWPTTTKDRAPICPSRGCSKCWRSITS